MEELLKHMFDFMIVDIFPIEVAAKCQLRFARALLGPDPDTGQMTQCGAWVRSHSGQYWVEINLDYKPVFTKSSRAENLRGYLWGMLHELAHIANGDISLDNRPFAEWVKARLQPAHKIDPAIQAYVDSKRGNNAATVKAMRQDEEAQADAFANQRIDYWLKICHQYLKRS